MRLLPTILVWTIAFASAGAWWSLRDGSSRDGLASAGGERTQVFGGETAIDVDGVDVIRLERGAGRRYLFRKVGQRWTQVEPFAAELDDFSARQLLVQAADLRAFRSEPGPADGGEAGRLTLEAGDRRWELRFERRGVAGRAWVRVNGTRHVTDAGLYERAVEMDPKEWRSRFLFPESLGTPSAIRRITAKSTIELTRTGGRWAITSPVKTRADAGRLEELTTAILRSRSDGFLVDAPETLAPFGLATPDATLAIDFATEGGTVTRALLIGAPLGVGSADRYAMIEGIPSVVRLSTGTQSLLFPAFESLIDPVATGVRAADVKRIEIRLKSGETVELTRSLDQWTVAVSGGASGGASSAAIPANVTAVQGLLAALCEARAPEMAFGEFPQAMEVATVLLFGFDGAPLDVVRVARDTKSSRWGFENGDRTLRVHAASFALPLAFEDFSRSN